MERPPKVLEEVKLPWVGLRPRCLTRTRLCTGDEVEWQSFCNKQRNLVPIHTSQNWCWITRHGRNFVELTATRFRPYRQRGSHLPRLQLWREKGRKMRCSIGKVEGQTVMLLYTKPCCALTAAASAWAIGRKSWLFILDLEFSIFCNAPFEFSWKTPKRVWARVATQQLEKVHVLVDLSPHAYYTHPQYRKWNKETDPATCF